MAHHSRCLIVDQLDEYGEVAVQVGSFEELVAYIGRTDGRWRICYFNDHLDDDFPLLCDAAYALGDLLFVIEEADLFCNPVTMPDELARIVKYGRHRGVQPMALSRRPSEVHRLLTSQAYEIYCFTTQEPRDLEYLGKLVGKEFADGLAALPPLHYRYQNLWDRSQPPADRVLTLPAAPARAGGPAKKETV